MNLRKPRYTAARQEFAGTVAYSIRAHREVVEG